MPTSTVISLAKKAGIALSKAEGVWASAKKKAEKAGKSENWAYITSIFKNMLGLTEENMMFCGWPIRFVVENTECTKKGAVGRDMQEKSMIASMLFEMYREEATGRSDFLSRGLVETLGFTPDEMRRLFPYTSDDMIRSMLGMG